MCATLTTSDFDYIRELVRRQSAIVLEPGMEYLVEALDIVARGEVKPMIEVFPKERVAEAYQRVVSGAVRFKAVVTY